MNSSRKTRSSKKQTLGGKRTRGSTDTNNNGVVKQARACEDDRIDVREMCIDDLASVFHLGNAVFVREYANLYRTWDEYEVTSMYISDTETCWVAENEEKQIVGFCLATTIVKKRSSWKYAYIIWMGVDPNCQKKGIGHVLFENCRKYMVQEGARIMMIETQGNNTKAINFFKRQGFRCDQELVYLSCNVTTTPCPPIRSSHPPKSLVVREMRIEDIKKVFHLGEEIFAASISQSMYRSWDEFEVVEPFNSGDAVIVAEDSNGDICGFCLGSAKTKRGRGWSYGFLTWIGVRKDYRRKGVGTRLYYMFRDIMMKEESVRHIFCDVETDHAPAITFFQHHGFGDACGQLYMTANLDK